MGKTSAIGREARLQVTTQAKIKDHLFMYWNRKASSWNQLAGRKLIVQNSTWQDVAKSLRCNVAWLLLHKVAVTYFYAMFHCVTD